MNFEDFKNKTFEEASFYYGVLIKEIIKTQYEKQIKNQLIQTITNNFVQYLEELKERDKL